MATQSDYEKSRVQALAAGAVTADWRKYARWQTVTWSDLSGRVVGFWIGRRSPVAPVTEPRPADFSSPSYSGQVVVW